MNENLKVANMIVSGMLPLNRALHESEVRNLIKFSKNFWTIVNEEMSPIFQLSIEREELTKSNRKKRMVASIWNSGKINIVGVTNIEEAQRLYDLACEDLKRFCGRAMQ